MMAVVNRTTDNKRNWKTQAVTRMFELAGVIDIGGFVR
jgi:hypothetical protein